MCISETLAYDTRYKLESSETTQISKINEELHLQHKYLSTGKYTNINITILDVIFHICTVSIT